MFSALIARIVTPARDYSAEHKARKVARNEEAARLARIIGNHMARTSHTPDGMPSAFDGRRELRSERDANAAMVEDFIRRETERTRDMQRAGHRLYKETARALVNRSE